MFAQGIHPNSPMAYHVDDGVARQNELIREAETALRLRKVHASRRSDLETRIGDLLVSLGQRLRSRAVAQRPELVLSRVS